MDVPHFPPSPLYLGLYLKTENQILRSKLPKRVLVTPDERRQLVKAGRGLGEAIKELVAIVQPSTLLRWINGDDKPKSKKKQSTRNPGRPRTREDIRALVVRIATETGWGYTRVLGELRKLGYRLSRQTVKNILLEHGIDPGPKRGKGTWDEFIKIHASTMWASDFCSKRVWTLKGPIDLYLLVFLQIGSRRAWVSSATAHPDSAWVAQQARNFCMDLPYGDRQRALVLHDADTKFTDQFREILKSDGLRPKKLIPVSPNLNAYVERFIQTILQECLDHFVVVGQLHLDYIVREFLNHYHEERPHQGLGNVTLAIDPPKPSASADVGTSDAGQAPVPQGSEPHLTEVFAKISDHVRANGSRHRHPSSRARSRCATAPPNDTFSSGRSHSEL